MHVRPRPTCVRFDLTRRSPVIRWTYLSMINVAGALAKNTDYDVQGHHLHAR
jgi:hypothetical protein